MLKFIYFLLIAIIFVSEVFALTLGDNIAKVTQISSSGKTLILDRGRAKSFARNELAYLLGKQVNKSKKRDAYVIIAKLKLVKERVSTSVWSVLTEYKNDYLQKGKKYLFFTQSQFLNGRAKLKVRRKEIIAKKNKMKTANTEGLADNGDSLSERKKKYNKFGQMHSEKSPKDYDFKLVDYSALKEQDDKSLKGEAVYMSPHNEDFKKRADMIRFDKMIHAFLLKANGEQKDHESFYLAQRKDPLTKEISDNTLTLDATEVSNNEEFKRENNYKRIAQEYSQKGPSWSDDLSDEELSRVLYNVGVLREQERRKSITAHQYDSQLFFSAGIGYTNGQTNSAEVISGNKFSFGVNFESYLLKSLKILRRYSVELGLRYSQDYAAVGAVNAELQEVSLSAHLNWYPFQHPQSLSENIIFLGLSLRSGFSSVTVPSTQDTGNYQSTVFPGLRAGVKYNFENSYGVRIVGSFESVTISQISSESSTLADKSSYSDGKISFALSKFY